MSGDTQPKKRKDKKRKKDDEDMVKETTVHAPKPQSTGAAQAAKDPSDIQMHIHSDHGTGGHWCAKIVFFILLSGLGALIGLIIMENRGVSNADTPLSESRYSEFFSGWVDENRQDDHHHDEILAAINSLDDHDDHGDEEGEHGAADDHDDDQQEANGGEEDDDHDDGAPYAEEEDHDDEDGGQPDEDDEDEGPALKLDDDEVEEIFAQQEAAARQEAFANAGGDDDDGQDDGDDGDNEEDDDDDDGATGKSNINENDDDDDDDDDDGNDETVKNKEKDDEQDDDNDDDDDDDGKVDNDNDQDNENDDVVTQTTAENNAQEAVADDNDDDDNDDGKANENDEDDDDEDDIEEQNESAAKQNVNDDGDDNEVDEDDDDDDDNESNLAENDEPVVSKTVNAEATNARINADEDDDDDDGDDDNEEESADNIAREIEVEDEQDDTPFDEEQLSNALNSSTTKSIPSATQGVKKEPANQSVGEARSDLPTTAVPAASPEAITGDTLKNQMDELVRNYNKLAESLDVPLVVEETVDAPQTATTEKKVDIRQDVNDDGDQDEIEEVQRGSESANSVVDDDDDDDDDNNADDDDNDDGADGFNDFVDNDGGEEEYLAKLRSEQQRRAAAEEERKAAIEPQEETSLTVKIFVGVALLGAAHLLLTSPRGPTKKPPATAGSGDEPNVKINSPPASSSSAAPSYRREDRTETAPVKSVLDDFLYAGPTEEQLLTEPNADDVIEANVIIFDENDDAERYSGDEYEYELEDMEEELEEETEEPADDEEERKLIKQEQEIGAFVPITFEEFNSMYRSPPEEAELMVEQQPQQQFDEQTSHQAQAGVAEKQSMKNVTKESLLARKKPPKGAVNKLIYGLHKEPIVIPTDQTDASAGGAEARVENVSVKGEAKSVLTALLSEIPSPPIEHDHEFGKLTSQPSESSVSGSGAFSQRPTVVGRMESGLPTVYHQVREKHVEFLLPEREAEFELDSLEPFAEQQLADRSNAPADNGSKENLFIPDASEEEADEYADEEYDGLYDGEEGDILYEDEEELDDEIESVLLNQYGSDEEEEPLTDDNIPPGGEDDEASDVDDSDLMRRLEQKYGKLPATETTQPAGATGSPEGGVDADDEAAAAGWTKIPSRAEETDRSYQEELRRAQQQLDEKKAQEALTSYERIVARRPHSIRALVGRARALDLLAEQRRSNVLLTDAIAAYRKVIDQELAVDDETLSLIGERCIDRMRFQGQHARAVDIHRTLIRRFDDEPHYRNQLAVTYLYMNRLPEAKAVLHETLLRWIEDGFALVHYGFVLKTHDQNMELAAQYLQEGIETGHQGTQDGRFYFHLGDALQRLGRTREALDVYRKGVTKKLFLSVYQRSLYNVEGLRSRPFWTVEQTTYSTELERVRSQWSLIRDEGLKLLNAHGVFVNETENLRDRGDWKQLELFSRGARVERNCARAPLTCRLVEQHLPAARSCKRGQVKFSVMLPGTHVWPHCGPTNCRIRAHLGLNVPDGTHIRVAEETRSWENGKWLIFDDSFEHEVWHNGTTTRLVLIVDLWHPDLTESQRRSLSPI